MFLSILPLSLLSFQLFILKTSSQSLKTINNYPPVLPSTLTPPPSITPRINIVGEPIFDIFTEASILAAKAYDYESFENGSPINGTTFTCMDILLPSLWSSGCAYIARDDNPSNPRIVVSIRGTHSIADILTDLNIGLLPNSTEMLKQNRQILSTPGLERCINCQLHAGFWQESYKLLNWLTPRLTLYQTKYPSHNLLVVGHSLGGAVSEIIGTVLQKRGLDPTVITFGSPRVGSPEWAAFVDEAFNNANSLSRLTHSGDLIPHVPFLNTLNHLFQHPSNEFWIPDSGAALPPSTIDTCNGGEDPTCAESDDGDVLEKMVRAIVTTALAASLELISPSKAKELLVEVGKILKDFEVAHSSYITNV